MGFQLINDAYKLATSIRNTLPELRVSRITLLNFTMTAPDLPTARSVYPGDFVTNHDELTQFLASQQKQIHLLEAHVHNLAQGIIAISGSSSNARLQAIPDSPKEEKPALAVGLQWSENMPASKECRYDHCIAQTPFGRFLIAWKSWEEYDSPTVDETPWSDWGGFFNSVDEAKAACQREFDKRLEACAALSTQPNPIPDGETC
jgi:hypothetical protein